MKLTRDALPFRPSPAQQAFGHPVGEDDPAVSDLLGQIDHQHGVRVVADHLHQQFQFCRAVHLLADMNAHAGDQAQVSVPVVDRGVAAPPVLRRLPRSGDLIGPGHATALARGRLQVLAPGPGAVQVQSAQLGVLQVVQSDVLLGVGRDLGVFDGLRVDVEQFTVHAHAHHPDRQLIEQLLQLLRVQSAGAALQLETVQRDAGSGQQQAGQESAAQVIGRPARGTGPGRVWAAGARRTVPPRIMQPDPCPLQCGSVSVRRVRSGTG